MRASASLGWVLGTAAAGLLLLGTTPHVVQAQEVNPEPEAASLMKADRALSEASSASSSPLDVFMARVTDDVIVLAPDTPMARGREASRAVFAELYAMPGFSLSWTPTTAEASGDLGYTIGTYHMEFQDSEGSTLAIDGKYMTVWKQQPDGTWKVAVDMFNANGPPARVEEEGS